MFPCWGFDHWETSGVPNYRSITTDLLNLSYETDWIQRENKILWAGAITHKQRHVFLNRYSNSPHFDLRVMRWLGGGATSSFTPLSEYTNYRFSLDLRGNGYSARNKYLLHTGSTLCFLEREFTNEFYWNEFIPNQDYVLIRHDQCDGPVIKPSHIV